MTIMKKIFILFLLLCLFTAWTGTAQILTVSSNSRIPAQYTSLATALDAASPEDSIYLHPSTTVYASNELVVDKSLVIIGGWFNNNYLAFEGRQTVIGQINITGKATNVVIANCEIRRLNIRNLNGTTNTFESITLVKNHIPRIDIHANQNNSFNSDNILIRNNIIGSLSFQNWSSASGTNASINIENNIIGSVANANGSMIVLSNNFFIPASISFRSALANISNLLIVNNIFYGSDNATIGIGLADILSCTVSHNLSFKTSDNFPTTNNSNSFIDNITKTPGFTNFKIMNSYQLNDIISYDFELLESSPAKGAGTEGADIGIAGGNYPFDQKTRFNFPFVESVSIENPVLGQGEKLRFSIRSSYPKN